jgi:hypothetical protein
MSGRARAWAPDYFAELEPEERLIAPVDHSGNLRAAARPDTRGLEQFRMVAEAAARAI